MGAERLSEALMVNSTLFKLKIDIPQSATQNVRDILLRKGATNQLASVIPRLLDNDPTVTVLHFHESYLNDVGTTQLCEALMLNSIVTSLDVYSCYLGDLGVARICEVLERNTSLVSLNLGFNEISDKGAKVIAEVLKLNSTLVNLNLMMNNFGSEGEISLGNGLIWNQTLTQLYLEKDHRYLYDIGVV